MREREREVSEKDRGRLREGEKGRQERKPERWRRRSGDRTGGRPGSPRLRWGRGVLHLLSDPAQLREVRG